MAKEKKKGSREKEDESLDIDLGIGKFNLGGLFNSINKLVDFAQTLEEAGGEIRKEGEFTVKGTDRKGIFGFSVRNIVGKDGKETPIVRPFGNIKKTAKGPVVEDTREPIVDIFEEGDVVQIVAELPGVLETEIEYTIEGDILILSTTGSKKYSKEILLPYLVADKPVERSYKAGIWELKLHKK